MRFSEWRKVSGKDKTFQNESTDSSFLNETGESEQDLLEDTFKDGEIFSEGSANIVEDTNKRKSLTDEGDLNPESKKGRYIDNNNSQAKQKIAGNSVEESFADTDLECRDSFTEEINSSSNSEESFELTSDIAGETIDESNNNGLTDSRSEDPDFEPSRDIDETDDFDVTKNEKEMKDDKVQKLLKVEVKSENKNKRGWNLMYSQKNVAMHPSIVNLQQYKMYNVDQDPTDRMNSYFSYLESIGINIEDYLPDIAAKYKPDALETEKPVKIDAVWENFEVKEDRGYIGKYACQLCFYKTEERDKYLQHKLRHKNLEIMKEKGYTHFCTASPKCVNKGFSSGPELQEHFIDAHVKKKETCDHCSKVVPSRYYLAHIETFHSKDKELVRNKSFGDGVCINCGYDALVSKTKECLSTHLKKKGKYHDKKCEKCEVKFDTWSEKNVHMEKVHENIWYFRCDDCGEVFEHKFFLNRHKRQKHSREKTETCMHCNKMFYKGYLACHIREVHEISGPINCEQCGRVFERKSSFDRHKQRDHGPSRPCEVCGKVVKEENWSRHSLSHLDPEKRPFKCEKCPKGFVNEKGRNEHMNIHTGNRPYKCETCGADFNNSSNLYHHKKSVHLGIKRVFKKKNEKSDKESQEAMK